jgi:sigma-B regulation protein RsbU (phosphoserine phosphatase)
VVLEPGDVVLYYTDGVSEALGFTGERFDEERLQRHLAEACRAGKSAQGVLDALFERLDRFVGSGRQPDDDASMVVLKVREEVMLPSLPG